jgi:hypothetical protein
MNNLRPLLTLCLGLPRHRPLHVLGQIHTLDLHKRHLDSPWIRMLIQNLLQALVQLLALAEQIVESHLASTDQRRLRELRRCIEIVFTNDGQRPPENKQRH